MIAASPYLSGSLLQTRMHVMPTEAEQYDTLLANLRQQLARGGMSYAAAVIVDDIISILVGVQSEVAGEPQAPDRAAPRRPSP